MSTLADETVLTEGIVPDRLSAPIFASQIYAIGHDEFLMRLPNGLAFHYARGKGVTVQRSQHVTDGEVQNFLEGSVYGAIAWLNGLVPLHASAVAHNGRAYAFTGHSGKGKSTLAAGLTRRGLPLHADDILVVKTAGHGAIISLPGHKRLKLWEDALELTAIVAGPRLRPELPKRFAAPHVQSQDGELPLARIYFLEATTREEPTISPIKGNSVFKRIPSMLYRKRFYDCLADQRHYFALLKRLANDVSFFTFDRPFVRESFDTSLDCIEAHIRADG